MPCFYRFKDWVRWLRSLRQPHRNTYRRDRHYRLRLEELETRLAPATYTWDGGSVLDSNWKTKENWVGDVAPGGTSATMDDLIFGPSGTSKLSTNNDFNNGVFKTITFASSGYTVAGNKLTLGDPSVPNSGHIIVNSNAAAEIIKLNIEMGAPPGTKQFFTVNSGGELTISGPGKLSGATGSTLSKDGAGILYLTSANTFTGPIQVGAGIVQITHAQALGDTTAITTVEANAQLQVSSASGITINENLILNGSGIFQNGALLNVDGGNTWAGTVKMDSDATIGSDAGNLTFTGQISDLGAGHSLTKAGPGQLTFNVANTYRGKTTINNGILEIQHKNALGTASNTAATGTIVNHTVTETGMLRINDVDASDGLGLAVSNELLTLNFSGQSNQGALLAAAGNNSWSGDVILGSAAPNGYDVAIGVAANATLTISGVIKDPNGSYNLTKVGFGQLIFTRANTYRGATTVAAGILSIRDSKALGDPSGSGTTVQNNATLALEVDDIVDSVTGSPNTLNITEVISITGTGSRLQGALDSVSGINRISGTVQLFSTFQSSEAAIGVEADARLGDTITFRNALGNSAQPTLTSVNNLTGTNPTAPPSISIATTLGGGTGTNAVQTITFGGTITGGTFKLKYNASTSEDIAWDSDPNILTNNIQAKLDLLLDKDNTLVARVPAIDNSYFPTYNASGNPISGDWSLTVNGVAGLGTKFIKLAGGHLVLPNANSYRGGSQIIGTSLVVSGGTEIRAGWVTIQNSRGLGQKTAAPSGGLLTDTLQPATEVFYGAALHLKPNPAGMTLDNNLKLSGPGIDHAFSMIHQKGALVSLAGSNTLTGNIVFNGNAGIGVQQVDPSLDPTFPSELRTTGWISETPAGLKVNHASPALNSELENSKIIDVGDTSGTIFIDADLLSAPDSLKVYYGSQLLYDSSTAAKSRARITINFAPTTADSQVDTTLPGKDGTPGTGYTGGSPPFTYGTVNSTQIRIVMNEGGGSPGAQWQYSATATPLNNTGGGFTKWGQRLLVLQGEGTYSGDSAVAEGVVRVQHDTALGTAPSGALSTTTVEAGAALELAASLPANNGGIGGGTQVWSEHLVLNGAGNTFYADAAPLVNMNGTDGFGNPMVTDTIWRGPVTLNTNGVTVTFQDGLSQPTMTADGTNLTGGASGSPLNVVVDTTTPGGMGQNAVQTISFTGNVTGGTFTLTYDNGTPLTTGPIAFSANATTLAANIQAALDAILGAMNTDAAPSATIDVRQGTRLTLFGDIDDAVNLDRNGSDLNFVTTGGSGGVGELALWGNNTFRGTTYVNQGTVLIVGNGQALGNSITGESQDIALSGDTGGSFNLSFNGQTIGTPLPYNATAPQVQAALNALSTIGGSTVGGSVSVTRVADVITVTFGGNLAGFHQPLLIAMGIGGTIADVTLAADGGGATIVSSGASVVLQGNITVPGEPLLIQSDGVDDDPAIPARWFQSGPAPIIDGQTPGSMTVTGRITGVTVDPQDPNVIYVSTAGGGAWKTRNAGLTWQPLFDASDLYAGGSISPLTSPAPQGSGQGSGSASVSSLNTAELPDGVKKITWHGVETYAWENRWIVGLSQPKTAQEVLQGLPQDLGFNTARTLGNNYQLLLEGGQGLSFDQLSGAMANFPGFRYIEPDFMISPLAVPNDPDFGSLWGLHNTGQTGGTPDADIDAPEAWDLSTGSSTVVVGVIDTGIDYNHSDIVANMWTNPGEVPGDSVDNDLNGYIDDVYGYDFVNNDSDPFDDNDHGTHVAGTIGAVGNNATGVVGVNWNVQIMALKFLDAGGSGSTSDAIDAINYATMMRRDHGVNVRVTNNSWGGGGFSQALSDAIQDSGNEGLLFVAAAGNDGTDNDSLPFYPSGYDLPNVISVAATDDNDQLAGFSNFGATSVDLGAPGVNILSTFPNNDYQTISGTSMAAPHVAGVAALAWSVDPTATPDEVKAAILAGVDLVPALAGVTVTGGRLNAFNTLINLGLAPPPPPPATPNPLFTGAIAVDPNAAGTIYLGTGEANNSTDSYYGTGIYKSTDYGTTWDLVDSLPIGVPRVLNNVVAGVGRGFEGLTRDNPPDATGAAGPSVVTNSSRAGDGTVEDSNIIDFGYTSGTMVINADLSADADRLEVYFGPRGTPGSTLLYDSSASATDDAVITISFTPTSATTTVVLGALGAGYNPGGSVNYSVNSTQIEIVMNSGGGNPASTWQYDATIAGYAAYVETVNNTIAIYNKSDRKTMAMDDFGDFWYRQGGLTPTSFNVNKENPTSTLLHPVVIYNELAGRFIVGQQDVDYGANRSKFFIAVSKDSDPTTLTTGADGWYFFEIGNTHSDNRGTFDADYEGNFGYNRGALVFTLNMYPNIVTQPNTIDHVLVTSVEIADLTNGIGSMELGGSLTFFKRDVSGASLRPTVMHDSASVNDDMWLLMETLDSSGVPNGTEITLVRMRNLLSGSPPAPTTKKIDVDDYLAPAAVLDFGGVMDNLSTGSRIMKAAMRNNRIVAVHTVGVPPATSGDPVIQNAAQWYIIDDPLGFVDADPPTDQGRVGFGDDTYVSYPAIDINVAGDIGMTFMRSGDDSSNDYMSMWVTGRNDTYAAGAMADPLLVPKGTGVSSFNIGNRAGQLSGINIDPDDDSFWAVSEFAASNVNWGTAIANFIVPDISTDPPTILATNNNGQGFVGLSTDNPPDPNGAAGPSSYVETVNQAVAIYEKSDTSRKTIAMDDLADFWYRQGGLTPAGLLPGGSGASVLRHPVVVYDEIAGVFIIGDQDVDLANDISTFNIAVSTSSTPGSLTTADWNFFQVDTSEAGYDADYPGNMGYNDDALVFTLNMMSGSSIDHVNVWSVAVADLVAGTQLVLGTNVFRNRYNGAGASLRPVVMHSTQGTNNRMWLVQEHLLGSGAPNRTSIDVVRMTNVLSTSASFVTTELTTAADYGSYVSPTGRATYSFPNGSGSRIMKAAAANWNDGATSATSIVAAHSVGLLNSSNIDVIQWYRINISFNNPSNPVPVLADQGVIGDDAANNTFLTFPAIDINPVGDIGLSFMRSDPTLNLSMWVTGRKASDPAGLMGDPALVRAQGGTINYNLGGRAGELSGINVDPVDGTFWTVGQFARTATEWGTPIGHFQIDPGQATNPFDGKAISKIIVDPVVDSRRIYAAVSDLASNGVAGGNAGIWRFQEVPGSGGGIWRNLTARRSAYRLNNNLLPGPDDDDNVRFYQSNTLYSDLAVMQDPVIPTNRFIVFAQGTPSGGAFPYSNAVFISLDSGNTWHLANTDGGSASPFPVRDGTVPYPYNGVIKLGMASNPPPGTPVPGTSFVFNVYAASTYPTGGANPNLANTFREIWKTRISWDFANSVWVIGPWDVLDDPPPANYLGNLGHFSTSLYVNPNNFNQVFVGGTGTGLGQNVVLRFNDNGDGSGTWTDISREQAKGPHAGVHAITMDRNGKLLVGTDGGIWRRDPAASPVAWNDLNGNLAITQFNGMAIDPSDANRALGGSQHNGTELFSGSQRWDFVEDNQANAVAYGGDVRIDPNNPNLVYAILYDGTTNSGTPTFVRKSSSGGSVGSWVNVTPPGGLGSQALPLPQVTTPLVLDNVNTSRLIVGSRRVSGTPIYESLNQGGNWTPLYLTSFVFAEDITAIALPTYQGVFVADPSFSQVTDIGADTNDKDTIYVVMNGQIHVTKNHGVTWVNRGGLGSGTSIADIHVDPRNRDTVYAVSSSAPETGTGRAFVSTNVPTNTGTSLRGAAVQWTNITGDLPDVPVWKVVIDPRNNHVYVGTEIGVFVSTDAYNPDDSVTPDPNPNATWTRFGKGLPLVQVKELVLNQALNTLTAGSYGRSSYTFFLDETRADTGVMSSVSGSAIWTGPVILAGASPDVFVSAQGTATLNIVGTISDQTPDANYTLNKIGAGNVILSGVNVYGGDTNVLKGVLVVRNDRALGGSVNGTTVIAGTALELQSSVTDEPLYLNGDGFQFNGHYTGALRNSSNNNNYTGPITLQSGPNVTIGVDSGSKLTITNSISDYASGFSQAYSVTKEGTGTLVLAQGIPYNVTFQGAYGSSSQPTMTADGSLLTGTRPSVSVATIIPGDASTNTDAVQTITFGGNLTGGTFTLTFNGQTTTPITWVADADGLRADIRAALDAPAMGIGAGNTLVTPNTYTGGTIINQGVVQLTNGLGLGTGNVTSVLDGAQVQLAGTLEVQSFTVGGSSGNFNLTFNGQTTPNLPHNATGALVQSAFNALSSIGGAGGMVSVTKTGSTFTVTFMGPQMGGVDVPLFSATPNGGANIATLAATELGGGTGLPEVQAFSITGPGLVQNNVNPLAGGSLNPGTTYYYLITATNAGGDTFVSNEKSFTPSGGNNTAGLSWNLFPGATAYKVYRSTSAGSYTNKLLTTINSGSTVTYSDTGTFTGTGTPPTQPTFNLSFMGSAPTANLSFDADASAVEAALNLLPTIGAGGVTVTKNGTIYRVTFQGPAFAGVDVPLLALTAKGGVTVNGYVISEGSGPVVVPGTQSLRLSGTGIFNTGALESVNGNNTWMGPITLESNPYLSLPNLVPSSVPPIDVALGAPNAGDTLTIGGVINESGTNSQGTSDFGLTKVGNGKVVLTQPDNYTGTTTVTSGILAIQDEQALGTSAVTPEEQQVIVTGFSGTFTLTFNGETTGPGSLNYNADETEVETALNMLPTIGGVGGSVSVQTQPFFGAYIHTITFGGSLAGFDLPQITAAGINGADATWNTKTQGTGGTVVNPGATLQLDLSSKTVNEPLWLSGPGEGGTFNVTFQNTLGHASQPTMTVNASLLTGVRASIGVITVVPGTATANAVQRISFGDNISGGTFTLTFNGETTSPISWIDDSASLQSDIQAALESLTSVGAGNIQVNARGALENVSGNNTWSGRPILLASDSSIGVSAGELTVAADLAGADSTVFSKVGPGTLILNQNNSFAGSTSINEGTLLADPGPNSALKTIGAVTLNGGTLGGTGTVGAVTSGTSGTGGIVAPGDSPGTLNVVGPVVWNSFTSFDVELNGTAAGQYDVLNVNGTVDLGGAQLTGSVGFVPSVGDPTDNVPPPDTFDIIVATSFGTPPSSFASGNSVFISGFKFQIDIVDVVNPVTLELNQVLRLTRVLATPTVTVSSSDSDSVYGQDVTLTATVLPDTGGGTPAGTVAFIIDGATVTSGVALSSGVATYQISTLSITVPGPAHSVQVNFTATDGIYNNGSGSLAGGQTVNKANSVTTVSSSAVPTAVFGQTVTFTATVSAASPSSGTPDGTVSFVIDSVTVAAGLALSGGQATYQTSTLSISAIAHSVKAVFSDTDTFYNNSSGTLPGGQSVVKANSSVTVTSSASPAAVFGQTVTFTAVVSAVSPGSGTPAGTVNFVIDGTTVASAVVLSSGQATFQTSTLSVSGSPHSVVVNFTDTDGKYNNSSGSLAGGQTVNKADTSVAVSSSNAAPVFGQAVTFTATVSAVSPGTGTPAGTVSFVIDGSTAASGIALSSGVATYQTSSLNVPGSPHAVVVNFTDTDGKYNNGSGSLAGGQAVAKADSSLTVSTSANPSVFGQNLTFTAVVSAISPGSGTAGGTVDFIIDGTTAGSGVALSGGQATFQTATLSIAGSPHSVVVNFTDTDGNFNNSSGSLGGGQTVIKANSAVTVNSSANPSVFGQNVTFTATVSGASPSSGTPAGTVDFIIDGTTALSGVALSSGQATFQTATLSVGGSPHSVRVNFHDTDTFYNDNSGSLAGGQTVSKANSSVAVGSSDNPSVFGQTVTFLAAVSAVSPGTGVPEGTVSFIIDGSTAITGVALSGGLAIYQTSALSVSGSPHSVTVNFTDTDGNFNNSSGALAGGQTVSKANSSVAVSSSDNPSLFGQTATFTASVSAQSPGSGTPAGTVDFVIDGSTATTGVALVSGKATFQTSTLSIAGSPHSVVVSFHDTDGSFNDSSGSLAAGQTVIKADSTVAVSSSVNPSIVGQNVTFTALVSAQSPGSGTPAGTVDFIIDSTTVGSGVALSSGVATFQTATLAIVGSPHSVTVNFHDTDTFYNDNSGSLAGGQTVSKANSSLAVNSSANASVFGQNVTFTATVSAVSPGSGTPAGTVSFVIDGTTATSGVALASGQATFQTSTLTITGSPHSVTVHYNNTDGNFNNSSGALAGGQTVVKANSSVAVSSSVNASLFGQNVTFTAMVSAVSPGSGTPAGNASFIVDGTTVASSVALSSGQATFQMSTLSVAGSPHSVVVSFADTSGNFNNSSGALAGGQTVNKANTSTTLSTTNANAVYGQATIKATVAAVSPGSGTPTGSVTFHVDNGSGVTNFTIGLTSGVATLVPALNVGTYTISADYTTTANFNASSGSLSGGQTVTKANSAVAISSSQNPSVFEQNVTFTATVSAQSPGAGTPAGTVNFVIDTTTVASNVALTGGQATFQTSTLVIAGSPHSVVVSFADTSGNFNNSSGTMAGGQTVTKANSSVAVSSSVNPSDYNQNVTFTASVTAQSPGAGTPAGMVSFVIDGSTATSGVALSSGVATYQTSTLNIAGSPHAVVVNFSDTSGNFNNSSGALAGGQTVRRIDSTVTVTSSSAAPVYGENVTWTATVAGVVPGPGTPQGTVDFIVDGTTVVSGIVLSGGVGTFQTSALSTPLTVPGSPHAVVASFHDTDLNFNDSSGSLAGGQTITKANTSTTLGTTNANAVYGEATITATVAAVSPGSGTPTGTVTFHVNNGSSTTNFTVGLTSGVAALNTTLNVGIYTISADFGTDANFNASSGSLAGGQTVSKAASSVAISSSANPSVFGQNVTFTATVSAVSPGSGTPAGTVSFVIDGTTMITGVSLSSGQATFQMSTLTISGSPHSVAVNYSNTDGNFNNSSGTLGGGQTVIKADSAVTVSSSSNPAVFGQAVTWTATVAAASPGSGTPAGTVDFVVDGTTAVTGVALVAGKATFQTATLSVSGSPHSVTVNFADTDGNFNNSSGTMAGGQTITKSNSAVAISSSNNPAVFGQTVTWTATVSAVSPGSGTPAGTADFIIDGSTVATGIGLVSGQATFQTNTLTVSGSPHSVRANFNDSSGNFNNSSGSLAGGQTITKVNSSVAIGSSNNPAVFGQAVTFTATVSAASPGSGTPAGTVDFVIDGSTVAVGVALSGGQATFQISTLSVAGSPHSVRANFTDTDGNFNNSSGTMAGGQTVIKADTALAVSSSKNPSTLGTTVTFTATVLATSPGSGTPAGTVDFIIDGTTLASGVLLSGGKATYKTSSLSASGSPHSVDAVYHNTDGKYNDGAGSLSAGQTVLTAVKLSASKPKPRVNVAFSITASALASNGSLVPGYTGTATISRISGPGKLSGKKTVSFVKGKAVFKDLKVSKPGVYTIKIKTSTGLEITFRFGTQNRWT